MDVVNVEPLTRFELHTARTVIIPEAWGRDALSLSEMERALGLQPRGGATVRDMERGKFAITGPITRVVEAMVQGFKPDGF